MRHGPLPQRLVLIDLMALTLSQRLAQLAIPLIATAILSSCASDGVGEGFGRPLPTPGEVQRLPPYDPFGSAKAEAKPAPSARQQGNEGQNTVAKTQMAAVAPPAAPRAPAAPLDSSGALSPFAGMTAEELRAQWGTPSLTRNEAGAQLMQFEGKGCVVLAYLYPSAGGGMETAFAEAHPGGDSAGAVTGCLGKSARPREADASRRTGKPELIVKPD